MATNVLKYFDELKSRKINYSNSDFQSLYRSIVTEDVFGKALNYDTRVRCDNKELEKQKISEKIEGAFHIVLNVKVDARSQFMPFAYPTNTNPDNEKKAKDIIKKLSISYNFSNLLDDLSALKEEVVESISFCTTINNTSEEDGLKPLISELVVDDVDQEKSSSFYLLLDEILSKENNFIKLLSESYHNCGIASKLYYNILSFDFDIHSGQKLTHILIISENKEECKYFTQIRVRTLRDIVSIIRTRYISDISKKNSYESIKSAVAAIMSRNMSHNLGSHYLYYTKIHLERLAGTISSEYSPDVRGAAKVLAYMQARMDYLATIISNDKYPYGPVNFKSQIYDELTIDDFSKRHFEIGLNDKGKEMSHSRITNFLLSNLILSEDFTRPGILDDNAKVHVDLLKLQVKLQEKPNGAYKLFTGTNRKNSLGGAKKGRATITSEAAIKNAISALNIALPGGTMSCHAFFNVVENFIRNSAKYSREDFERTADNKVLTITIAIRPDADSLTQDGGYRYYDFIVYDNKKNATFFKKERDVGKGEISLYESMIQRLSSIKILDDDNSVEKENKGLKEMIFSAAWMRAYTFENDKTYADTITDIQNAESGVNKLKVIQDHCFELVAVEEKPDGDLIIYRGDEVRNRASRLPVNLGLLIRLPLFRKLEKIDSSLKKEELIAKSLEVYSDMVEVDTITDDISRIYTRVYVNANDDISDPVESFKTILRERFREFEKFRLVFGTDEEPNPNTEDSESYTIKFAHHLKDHVQDQGETLEDQARFAYADSVSGGNYTKTMNELFDAGLKEGISEEEKKEAEYFRLQIKESALTRITLIDERLHKNMVSHEKGDVELTLKNIRVMNYIEPDSISHILDLFTGNQFNDINNYYTENPDFSHFVSIHLGLIEKIINSKAYMSFVFSPIENDKVIYGEIKEDESGLKKWVTTNHNEDVNEYSLDDNLNTSCIDLGTEDRAKVLMYFLCKEMGGNQTHVTVHSGRGNYSKELEGPLDSYPFVSLSSIESAFNNSKMLLSQLFYNTRYVGKGIYNQKKKHYEKKNDTDNYNA